ncbi:MAG: hypothetical protein ACLPQS_00805 [Acidimicrobiales bacterium]
MRKVLVVTTILLAAIIAPVVAMAAAEGGSGTGNSPVNCQTSRWTETAVSTSSSSYSSIGALQTDTVSIYPATITVSAVVTGEPVEWRLIDNWVGGPTLVPPGQVPFTPAGSKASAFSFSWTDPGSAAAVHGHQVSVEWRRTSATGTSKISQAGVVITYKTDVCTGS